VTTHPVTISGKTYQTAELTCPECGAAMVLRVSRHGCFYGCSRYPQCDGTHDGIPATTPPAIRRVTPLFHLRIIRVLALVVAGAALLLAAGGVVAGIPSWGVVLFVLTAGAAGIFRGLAGMEMRERENGTR